MFPHKLKRILIHLILVLWFILPLQVYIYIFSHKSSNISGQEISTPDLAQCLFNRPEKNSPFLESRGPFFLKQANSKYGGLVDLTISLDTALLMKYLESTYKGEATFNPIPQDVNILSHNRYLCHDGPKWIIYVHSSAKHFDRRHVIRNTWGNHRLFKDGRTKVVFIIGTIRGDHGRIQRLIGYEQMKYRDIVQGDFVDDYHNMSIKAILGLRWVSTYCKSAEFVLKADDDAFVNIFKLMENFDQPNRPDNMIACHLYGNNEMKIHRNKFTCDKWCVHYHEFPGRSHYPPYCAGLAYLMTSDLVENLYKASKDTPFFWIDDIYVTGLLTSRVSRFIKDVNFVNGKNATSFSEFYARKHFLFENRTDMLFVHLKSQNTLYDIWNVTLNKLSEEKLQEISPNVWDLIPNLNRFIYI